MKAPFKNGDPFVFEGDLLSMSEVDYKVGCSVATKMQGVGADGKPDFLRVKFCNAEAVEVTALDLKAVAMEEYVELLRSLSRDDPRYPLLKELAVASVNRIEIIAKGLGSMKAWYLPGRLMGRHEGRMAQSLGKLSDLQKTSLRAEAAEHMLDKEG